MTLPTFLTIHWVWSQWKRAAESLTYFGGIQWCTGYWVAPFASLIHICLSVGLLLWRKTLKRLNKQVSRLWYRYKLPSLRLYDWGTASFLVVNDCFRGNCLGLYQWVCLSSNYERWRPYLFAVALLTPTSNILGVNSAVHEAFLN